MTVTSAEIAIADVPSALPWHVLPPTLADVLRPEVSGLARRILEEIQRQIQEYARPNDEKYTNFIRGSVEQALNQFVDRIANPAVSCERSQKIHRALGRNETLEGRSLDELQRAYRIGARLSWRRFMMLGSRAGVPPHTLLLLGEAIIAHIDELAALAVEGYQEAERRVHKVLATRRRRLLKLLSQPLISEHALEEAASDARWPLPNSVVVVALDGPIREVEISSTVRKRALVDLDRGEPYLLVPADTEQQLDTDWEDVFGGRRIVLSGPVPLCEVANALEWTRRVLVLIRQAILPDRFVTHCNDHLSSIVLLNDEPLAFELIKEYLAPLGGLALDQRNQLAGTLRAWLRSDGNTARIADRLSLDETVVREQLRELEELFGDTMRDSEANFSLELALRSASLLLKADRTQ